MRELRLAWYAPDETSDGDLVMYKAIKFDADAVAKITQENSNKYACAWGAALLADIREAEDERNKLKAPVKVFISQPMKDKTPEEIERERKAAIEFAEEMYGYISVIDSYFGEEAKDWNPIRCLGESIKLMSEADVVIFCPGWAGTRGCNVEHLVAYRYGLEIIKMDDVKTCSRWTKCV